MATHEYLYVAFLDHGRRLSIRAEFRPRQSDCLLPTLQVYCLTHRGFLDSFQNYQLVGEWCLKFGLRLERCGFFDDGGPPGLAFEVYDTKPADLSYDARIADFADHAIREREHRNLVVPQVSVYKAISEGWKRAQQQNRLEEYQCNRRVREMDAMHNKYRSMVDKAEYDAVRKYQAGIGDDVYVTKSWTYDTPVPATSDSYEYESRRQNQVWRLIEETQLKSERLQSGPNQTPQSSRVTANPRFPFHKRDDWEILGRFSCPFPAMAKSIHPVSLSTESQPFHSIFLLIDDPDFQEAGITMVKFNKQTNWEASAAELEAPAFEKHKYSLRTDGIIQRGRRRVKETSLSNVLRELLDPPLGVTDSQPSSGSSHIQRPADGVLHDLEYEDELMTVADVLKECRSMEV